MDPIIQGKSNLPAYYFKIQVLCGHTSRTVYRRYSQFRWLQQNLPQDKNRASPIIPPGTCFCQPQDDSFAQNRTEQLREFLRDTLESPLCASHPCVVAFLELDAIAS